MDSYEFELFAFWDDLEYADDSYWDYGLARKHESPAGVKRKRESAQKAGITDKRRRTRITYSREDDPLLLISRELRTKAFFEPAPMLENPVKYTFLADWRERYANKDGVIENKAMPVDMKRAAEAETMDTGEERVQDASSDMEEDGEGEGEWEDDDGQGDVEAGTEDEGPVLDPDMLKEILKQKLGEAGLGGEDEAAFMQVLAKMMSGEGDADDAAGDLTNTLLGKLNSNPASDSGLASWLSREGVELGDDDDASSVATVELPEGMRHSGLSTRQNAQDSPIDSVVGSESQKKPSTQMPLHSGSPTSSSKKRTATTVETTDKPSKKQKKVTFDVPPSSSDPFAQNASSEGVADLPTSEDPLMSDSTLKQRPTRSRTAAAGSKDDVPAPTTKVLAAKAAPRAARKRKAADAEATEEKPPEKKKTKKKKEADALETKPAASPMGPPARRTRAAKAKAEK